MAATTYKGFRFPFRRGSRTSPEAATDDQVLQNSLHQIVTTTRGERVMRPDFGTNAIATLFENPTPSALQVVAADVQGAIAKYEPRVILRKVTVIPVSKDATRMVDGVRIEITYESKLTGKIGTVYADLPAP